MLINQLLERNTHFLFHCAGVVYVARNAEQLGSRIALTTETCEPVTSSSADGRSNSDGFHVGHGSRASKEANGSREGGLEARLSRLAFERFDQRGLFTTDISAHSSVDVDIEIVARTTSVLAD
jgi:hypothetical protein